MRQAALAMCRGARVDGSLEDMGHVMLTVRMARAKALHVLKDAQARSLETTTGATHAPSSVLFLVVRPGAPSGVLAPSSDARSP